MAVEVAYTDEFKAWFDSLEQDEQDRLYRSVGLPEAMGVNLGFPYTSAIRGASFALRELRTQSEGDPLRTFYAFDPARQAVLLIGGDKTADDRFYERMVPLAERSWAEYLQETGQGRQNR